MAPVPAQAGNSAVVVRSSLRPGGALERSDGACQYRPDAILALHPAVYDQDRLSVGDLPVALIDVGLDRHVHLAELVLESEEANLLGCGWGLSSDHGGGHLKPAGA